LNDGLTERIMTIIMSLMERLSCTISKISLSLNPEI